MKFKLTNVAPAFSANRGGKQRVVNVTRDECAATITTRYEAIGYGHILTLAHYPMTVVLYEFE